MMGFLFVLIMLICVLLILIILIQNPKGGGLSSSFGGSGTQLFGGVKKTTDFLDKGTWGLSIALLALVLTVNVMTNSGTDNNGLEDSLIEGEMTAPAPASGNFNNLPQTQNQGGDDAAGGDIQIDAVEEE